VIRDDASVYGGESLAVCGVGAIATEQLNSDAKLNGLWLVDFARFQNLFRETVLCDTDHGWGKMFCGADRVWAFFDVEVPLVCAFLRSWLMQQFRLIVPRKLDFG
jgi:hypothetical protein